MVGKQRKLFCYLGHVHQKTTEEKPQYCYNPGGTQLLYSQKAADRILDRSTKWHNTESSHVTGETDQRLLAVGCICVSRVSRAHPACCSVYEK